MVASGFVLRHPGLDIEIASPRSGECSPYVLAAWLPYRHLGDMLQVKVVLGRERVPGTNAQLRDARVTRYHMIAASTFVGIKTGLSLKMVW